MTTRKKTPSTARSKKAAPKLRALRGLKRRPRRAWDPRPALALVKRAS